MLIGVDSADSVTQAFIDDVTRFLGNKPAFWGRYLFTGGVGATPVTTEEISLLHSNGISVLLIANDYRNIDLALSSLRSPKPVAVYLDVEAGVEYPQSVIATWVRITAPSLGIIAGVYCALARPAVQRAVQSLNGLPVKLWDAHWLWPAGFYLWREEASHGRGGEVTPGAFQRRYDKGHAVSIPRDENGIQYQIRQIAGNVTTPGGYLVDIDGLFCAPEEAGLWMPPTSAEMPQPLSTSSFAVPVLVGGRKVANGLDLSGHVIAPVVEVADAVAGLFGGRVSVTWDKATGVSVEKK